tara:strand:+ start:5913 stop:6107 length:195 start_codon:yes stop_codon:yes gene_type:complete
MDFEEEEEHEFLKRFQCHECGHTFCMECETEDMIPKFCPFCASPVYVEDDDDYKFNEDIFPFGD